MLPIYRADILQNLPQSIDATTALLASEGYVADRALSTLTFLSLTLNRPIFLEGEAGVGKTELAKVIAKTLGRDLIRLQCYEGLDASSSVYEWNFAGQMLAMRNGAEQGDIYSEKYLIKRALLQAVEPHPSGPPVLLIDEIDRTDAPFEADILQNLPQSIDATTALLASEGYVADRALSTLTFLSLTLNRPIFLEGEAGVGKTELAKVIAKGLGRDLIRLQCYEGLDASSSVYEWNFAGQMLAMRNGAEQGDIYSEKYLIKRALLQAVEPHPSGPPVLLIDEIDRTDAPFEAFLLEALSDFQVTVPELGVIKAPEPPIVILTSNRTREVHDALKRRCLYHWVDYPGFEREMEILRARLPEVNADLSREVVAFIQKLREEELFKRPGLAETLDWAKCLVALDVVALSPDVITDTIGAVLKYQDDIAKITGGPATRILEQIRQDMQAL